MDSGPARPVGSTNQTRQAKSVMLPIHAPSWPKRPAGVREPSGLNMCSVEMNKPASRKMCLVRSNMARSTPTRRPRKGPQRLRGGRCPRLPGVFTATKVSMLVKAARLRPQLSVCDSLRLPGESMFWNVGPSMLASTAGQHQAAMSEGSESSARQPAPKVEVSSSFFVSLPPVACSIAVKSGSLCQLPSGQSGSALPARP
mmetsp:Transcript_40584/g.128944  ORF Transcript_40584/g.128944 Transcript_40584/m.128944 type:complete len:200 (+) Transcript_40584:96-695(+)